jgi:CubicO group peptidase (beta-lactamase class C family)
MAQLVKDWEAQCMYVIRDGAVLAEWNFGQHKRETNLEGASVTKSFASTLIGIASRKGLLSIDEPASKYITEWSTTGNRAITIRHLLAMTSGLVEWTPPASSSWYGVGDVREAVITAKLTMLGPALDGTYREQTPGLFWRYHNVNTAALELVLSRATGQSVQSFAARELFDPLEMSVDVMTDSKNVPSLAVGFRVGCDDLAKLIQLYLNGGSWKGSQILSADYVRDATSRQITCGKCEPFGSPSWYASRMNGAYGLQWWLNAAAPSACAPLDPACNLSTSTGPTMPDLPTDMFYASGACNQLGAGIPSLKVVVVVLRRGCESAAEAALYWNNREPAYVFFRELAAAIR